MSEIVDARGLSCPLPVIKAKAALDGLAGGEVVVLLDEEVAKENVTRLAHTLGCEVELADDAGEYKLTIRKESQQ